MLMLPSTHSFFKNRGHAKGDHYTPARLTSLSAGENGENHTLLVGIKMVKPLGKRALSSKVKYAPTYMTAKVYKRLDKMFMATL